MAKKTLYRSVIQLEILSEEPIESMSLEEIAEECVNGSFSGVHEFKVQNQVVKGIKAARLTIAQGSNTEFFGMDDKGNELDEY